MNDRDTPIETPESRDERSRTARHLERQARVGILRNPNRAPVPPPRRTALTGRWPRLQSSRRPPAAGTDIVAATGAVTSPGGVRVALDDPVSDVREALATGFLGEPMAIRPQPMRGLMSRRPADSPEAAAPAPRHEVPGPLTQASRGPLAAPAPIVVIGGLLLIAALAVLARFT